MTNAEHRAYLADRFGDEREHVGPDADPERDLATDPADEEARRWEREMARADVARRDP